MKSIHISFWSSLYPEEPYELAFNITFSEGGAFRRQSVFFYQVSRSTMHDCFLGAVARYKGLKFISEEMNYRGMMSSIYLHFWAINCITFTSYHCHLCMISCI